MIKNIFGGTVMSENRYRYDTGCIIDQVTTEILTERQAVNRLNRQEILLNRSKKHIEAMIAALNHEIENSDGDLKEALIRVAHTELNYE